MGEQVRGGVYGEMFPQTELPKLSASSPDIDGLTDIDHVFGAACDWVRQGSGGIIFPGRPTAAMGAGVSLGALFS